MPDRILKLLRRMPPKQRGELARLIEMVLRGNVASLDLKKLVGMQDVYRVRKGNIRIIYRLLDGEVVIIAVERRSNTTYGKL